MTRTAARTVKVATLWIENGAEAPEDLCPKGGTLLISRRYPNAFRANDTVNCFVCKRPGIEHVWQLYAGTHGPVIRCSISEPGTDLRADTIRPTRMGTFIGPEPVLMYTDIERPVNEPTGTHVVVADVFDPAAHAEAIIAGIETTSLSFHVALRANADRICQRTPYKDWYVGTYHSEESADRTAADLNRYHSDAGRRWKVHPITNVDWCRFCRHQIVLAAGEWRHQSGSWAAECKYDIAGAPLRTSATPVPRRDEEGTN